MPLPAVVALDGVIRRYAWGSRTAIPELLGIEPDGAPAAELWLGAHPDDPSHVPEFDTTLHALLAADPQGLLGAASVARFGPRLPFLLKVLAVETAVSIQVHPSRENARAGFAAEDAAGIARGAPNRNYRDENHKPELLCALTPFEALCGFRPVRDTLRLFDDWAVAELLPVRALLAEPDGLRSAFTALLSIEEPARLVAAVTARAANVPTDDEWADIGRAVQQTAREFPGDVGVVLLLLLNHVRLQPGEAIYVDAGTVHCYLRGTGVEIMASSDNVLRCGLTPKHIDVAEVLKVATFSPLEQPRCPSRDSGAGTRFLAPVADFALSMIELDPDNGSCAIADPGPNILLCTAGHVEVCALNATVRLGPGGAAAVSCHEDGFTVRGRGQVFRAAVGEGI